MPQRYSIHQILLQQLARKLLEQQLGTNRNRGQEQINTRRQPRRPINREQQAPAPEVEADRGGQLRAIAKELEMSYSEFEEFSTRPLLSEFNLFKRGRNKTISNILKKQDGNLDTQIQIFDYSYEMNYNTHRRKFIQTVFFVQSKNLGLPAFSMEPETIFHKIGNYVGMQDIDFDQYPKFSGNYLLKGDDEDYIRFMMSEKLLNFFNTATGWYMEGTNFYLIMYKLNRRFPASSIKAFYEQGLAIYESMAKEMEWDPITLMPSDKLE